jgi:hypothetical protein
MTIAAVNSPIKPNKSFLRPVMIEFPQGYWVGGTALLAVSPSEILGHEHGE